MAAPFRIGGRALPLCTSTIDTRVCRTVMVAQPALGVAATISTYPQDGDQRC